jgi:hypothetical protein
MYEARMSAEAVSIRVRVFLCFGHKRLEDRIGCAGHDEDVLRYPRDRADIRLMKLRLQQDRDKSFSFLETRRHTGSFLRGKENPGKQKVLCLPTGRSNQMASWLYQVPSDRLRWHIGV